MGFISEQVSIKEAEFSGLPSLYFTFKNKLTEKNAKNAIEYWQKSIETNPFITSTLIWDCDAMNGFEPGARKLWYQCMNANKVHINYVVVIARSLLVRSAARVMLEFFGISGRIVKSKHQLTELELDMQII